VLAELSLVAFANIGDFIQIAPNGSPCHDFSKLTREQAAAIQELVVKSRPDDGC
jgi:hypothetical protein